VEVEEFVLESSEILSGEWKTVPGAPLVLGSQKAVVVRASAVAQFFRLVRRCRGTPENGGFAHRSWSIVSECSAAGARLQRIAAGSLMPFH
jgi:hypothetical protein